MVSRRRAWWLAALTGVAAVAAVGTVSYAKPNVSQLEATAIQVTATPIPHFSRARRDQTRFDNLDFLGGLILTSDHSAFGGWSGVTIDPDGRRILAISDAGTWLVGDLVYKGTTLTGLANARIGPLLGLGGKRLARERDRDAEGVRLVEGTLKRGIALVSFERNHRIARYGIDENGLGPALGYLKMPAEARRMSTNKGIEAIGLLRGGPLKGSPIAFSERLYDAHRDHTGWIWIAGEPRHITLSNIDDYDVTDVTGLPDGSVVILERRYRFFDGVRMRIRHVAAGDIRPGARLTGRVLIEASGSQEIDNMEGLAVHQGPRGETILTLISDNNFNTFLQRTILLQFRLVNEMASR
jgi:hypothetical protein